MLIKLGIHNFNNIYISIEIENQKWIYRFQIKEISDRDFKITIINVLKGSSGKGRQYAWTDGQFQQREGVKMSDANAVH